MLAEERKDAIRRLIETEGRVDLASLGERFQVSEDTVRRDLRALDAAGLVRRVRGGALRRSPAPAAYGGREDRDVEAKQAIARIGVKCVQAGMVVGIDNGTTALAFARALPMDLRFTAVTTSLPTAVELGDRQQATVVMPGGRVYGPARAVVGAAACRELARIRMDLAIIGTCGVDADGSLTALEPEEAELKRTWAQCAQQVVVLATREKIGVVETFVFAELSPGDLVITDAPANDPTLESLREKGVIVTTC